MIVAALVAAAALAAQGSGTGHDAGGHGAATGPGAPGAATVEIPGRFFAPDELDVLVGDTVTWRNGDHAAHTVVAADHSFHSERLSSGASFSATFDEPGEYRYHCSLHRSMQGVVRVSALGLTGPREPLAPGGTAAFSVLAPAGTGSVVLERLTSSGAEAVAGAAPDAGGRAALHLRVDEPGRYRARAGDLTSSTVAVAVAPEIAASARRDGRRVTVRATLSPPLPGATLAVKRYVRERFDYLPIKTARSGGGARVVFRLRSARRLALRVGVVKAPGGWSATDSSLLIVPRLRG